MKNKYWILLLLLSLIPPTVWAGKVMTSDNSGPLRVEVTVSEIPAAPVGSVREQIIEDTRETIAEDLLTAGGK